MRTLLVSAAFLLGGYLAIRAIAALYAIVDLGYAWRRYYPRILGGILGWGLAIAALAWLLPPFARRALLAGLVAFVISYLGLYVVRGPLLRWYMRR